MKTYCFALDLHDDPMLIEEYKHYHRPESIWPGVLDHIRGSGILHETIYLTGNRLVMILEANDDFSPEDEAAAGSASSAMQQWEALMWKYQKALPHAKPGQKWMPMEKIFEVS